MNNCNIAIITIREIYEFVKTFTCRGIPRNTRNTDDSLVSGTKLLLPSWLLGIRHEERDTVFTMLTVGSDPTTRGAPPRPNWTRLGSKSQVTAFFFSKYPRILAHRFWAWRHSHPQSHFYPGVLLWHKWLSHPPRTSVNTCTQCVHLTNPNDKI